MTATAPRADPARPADPAGPVDPAGPGRRAARDPALRRVRVAQFVGSTTDGAVLATAVLYAHRHLGVAPATVGVVLAVAAASALVLSFPIGVLADRLGPARAGAGLGVTAAAGLTAYALAGGLVAYAGAAICFAVTQAGLGAVRQAVVAAAVPPQERVRARAVMHTVLNGGMGLGTAWGAVALAIDHPAAYAATFAAGAVGALACAGLLAGVGDTGPPRGPATPLASWRVLRDGRFAAVTGLAAAIGLTMPVLSVILPLWIATGTGAPPWVAALALGLNTVTVLLVQTRWAARVGSDAAARRSALVAAAALGLATLLLGGAGVLPGAAAPAAAVLLGVLALTAGEVTGGAATWHAAFRDAPAHAQGRYQAVFGMAASVARIVGASLALPLVLAVGTAGWLVLGAVMAAAALALAGVALGAGARVPRA